MSRTPKLIAYIALLEMALVILADFAWRRGAMPWLPAPGPSNPHNQFMLVYAPAAFLIAVVYAGKRLASNRPRISDSHRRYLEGSLQVGAALIVALQGLFAYIDVTGGVMDRELMGRGVCAFTGLWMAIQGNAAAKLDPPSGEGAPGPGVWTRTLLRFGWIMVALGLANVVCAVALPWALFLPVMIATAVIGVTLELVYRRMTRPARTA